jgi:putative endonuclease
MGRNNIVGAWGEALAAEYLRKKRYTLVATGYRCRYGEIDLIVQNRRYLVFVEVKLRRSDRFAEAREFVDIHKQERLRSTASLYLDEFPTELQPRFDVIEVYAPDGTATKRPTIIHLEDAFS